MLDIEDEVHQRGEAEPMIEENRQLVSDEHVEFEK